MIERMKEGCAGGIRSIYYLKHKRDHTIERMKEGCGGRVSGIFKVV